MNRRTKEWRIQHPWSGKRGERVVNTELRTFFEVRSQVISILHGSSGFAYH